MNAAVAIIVSYLLGSFPTAYVVTRLRKGVDIREVGSRNLGAMNVIYAVGLAEGVLVLAVDIGKGALAVFVARWLGASLIIQLLSGTAAVAGHAFPVFLKFRGGRGGAACVGIFAPLVPHAIPFYVGLFFVVLLVTRFPTFSYGIAFTCIPIVAWLAHYPVSVIVFSVALPLMLAIGYMRRMWRMRSRGGSWRNVFLRRSLKDRL